MTVGLLDPRSTDWAMRPMMKVLRKSCILHGGHEHWEKQEKHNVHAIIERDPTKQKTQNDIQEPPGVEPGTNWSAVKRSTTEL